MLAVWVCTVYTPTDANISQVQDLPCDEINLTVILL